MKSLAFVCRGLLPVLVLVGTLGASAAPVGEIAPVTSNASPEARALLGVLYSLSGHATLTGQHNYPNTKSRNSEFAAKYTGKPPAVFSSDLGHAKADDSDSYLARPDIVQESIRQHRLGALVTLCWHAVPPTADEPVTFRQLPDSDPKMLRSVQGQLLDEQFKDVLTPGTALHQKWCAQVDAIAVFLKQLDDAHVPVLWRPYHEMNGDWFWWGGRTGEYSTIALYRQLFDRLVNHHHLTNLIWVWSVDRMSKPGMEHVKYFPGIDFVDVLALDVYGNDFAQSYYDSLVTLAQGKPITLGEVGNPPSVEILTQQPKWVYYVTWAGMVRNTSKKTYDVLMRDPRLLGLGDPGYWSAMAPYRQACGLPPLTAVPQRAEFSGHWVLNEDQSEFGQAGAGFAPAALEVVLQGNDLRLKTTRVVEFAEDQITEEKLTLDGAEAKSEFMNSPRATTAKLADDGNTLTMNSTIAFVWAPGMKMTTSDTWTIRDGGKILTILRRSHSSRGDQSMTLVFDRR